MRQLEQKLSTIVSTPSVFKPPNFDEEVQANKLSEDHLKIAGAGITVKNENLLKMFQQSVDREQKRQPNQSNLEK